MKLLTKEIISKMPKLYANDGESPEKVPIVVKFFHPISNWVWYVTEGERQENGDFLFFGLVKGLEKELGYFSLNEIKGVKGPMGLKVERDMYFGKHNLKEAQEKRI